MELDEEGDHGGLGLVVVVAEHHDVRMRAENAQRVFVIGLLALANPGPSELVLRVSLRKNKTHVHVEHEAQSDRAHDVRRPALFPLRQHLRVPADQPRRSALPVRRRVHEEDRPAAGEVGRFVHEEFLFEDEEPGTADAAHHFVRREEQRVAVVAGIHGRVVHRGGFVGARGRAVPADQCALLMHELVHRRHLRHEAGHIADVRQRDEAQRAAGQREKERRTAI